MLHHGWVLVGPAATAERAVLRRMMLLMGRSDVRIVGRQRSLHGSVVRRPVWWKVSARVVVDDIDWVGYVASVGVVERHSGSTKMVRVDAL